MFFNGIAYFFEQIYSQLNTTEADYCPYGLFSQPLSLPYMERLSLWLQIFYAQLLRYLAAIVVLHNLVAYRDRLA